MFHSMPIKKVSTVDDILKKKKSHTQHPQLLNTLIFSKNQEASNCELFVIPAFSDWKLMDYSPPGKNTGVGFHALLQGIFPTQGSNPHLPHCRQFLYCLKFSCSVMSDSLQPHESQHAMPPFPSPTPGVYSNSCPSTSVMPSSHLILCCSLLLLPPTPPSIRVFPN